VKSLQHHETAKEKRAHLKEVLMLTIRIYG